MDEKIRERKCQYHVKGKELCTDRSCLYLNPDCYKEDCKEWRITIKITLITVGKIKEKYFRDAIEEYTKRLSKYCRLEVIEVADEKTPDKLSPVEEAVIKEKEADRILKYVKEDAFVYTLEILGEKTDSVSFAKQLENIGIGGKSLIQFIIGGSLGLHEDVSKRADKRISFSDMTFPHQLMRVILLEQVYRAYRIINGEPYHK